jgi:hypothetical protein
MVLTNAIFTLVNMSCLWYSWMKWIAVLPSYRYQKDWHNLALLYYSMTYKHTYKNMHTCIHTYIQTHTYLYTYTYLHTYTYIIIFIIVYRKIDTIKLCNITQWRIYFIDGIRIRSFQKKTLYYHPFLASTCPI